MKFFTKEQLINKSSSAISKSYIKKSASTILNEQAQFADQKTFDIFLSHSFLDADVILGLKHMIEELGFTVYVDWIEDRQLDRSTVTQKTADTLRKRMKNCRCLFFATSENSPDSKWMPWELGYFDGVKGKVAIIPILDSAYASAYEGQEYLGLYHYASNENDTIGRPAIWINKDSTTYVSLHDWINGAEPYKRNAG